MNSNCDCLVLNLKIGFWDRPADLLPQTNLAEPSRLHVDEQLPLSWLEFEMQKGEIYGGLIVSQLTDRQFEGESD